MTLVERRKSLIQRWYVIFVKKINVRFSVNKQDLWLCNVHKSWINLIFQISDILGSFFILYIQHQGFENVICGKIWWHWFLILTLGKIMFYLDELIYNIWFLCELKSLYLKCVYILKFSNNEQWFITVNINIDIYKTSQQMSIVGNKCWFYPLNNIETFFEYFCEI